ncbi:MAG: hypothetical protein IPM84_14920 [Anaerolineae bacterium]|nr:hypothetical protein [Anaerolineae bacterium]
MARSKASASPRPARSWRSPRAVCWPDISLETGLASNLRVLDNGSAYRALACQGEQSNVITGMVFRDSNLDGLFDPATEAGIRDVTVRLFRDMDNNGIPNYGDILLATQKSTAGGSYTFVIGGMGQFVLDIDVSSIPKHHVLTTDNREQASFDAFGLIDTGNNFGLAKHAYKDRDVLIRYLPETPAVVIDDVEARYDLQLRVIWRTSMSISIEPTPGLSRFWWRPDAGTRGPVGRPQLRGGRHPASERPRL